MSKLVLDGAVLWLGDGRTQRGHVVVADGRIESVGTGRYSGDLAAIDLAGTALSPGMIDLMLLGGFDMSIVHDDAIEIARRYLRLGVTSVQFTGGMLPSQTIEKLASRMRQVVGHRDADAAHVWGVYMEGPFMDPDFVGGGLRIHAQAPTTTNVQRIVDLFGEVMMMMNISPGTEGDVEAVHRLRDAGKVVSMAHSNAPAGRVKACLDAGTTVLGHCWDNNSGLLGDSGVQQPTIEHVALTDDRVEFIHLICDGTHVHSVMVELVRRCRGVEAICLVTDANQKSGTPDGEFIRDSGDVFYKRDGVCRKKRDNGLAGSATFLPDDFRNFVRFTGVRPHEAIRTVTSNPARSLGIDDRVGLIAPGLLADLIAWDDRLRVRRIWLGGREIKPVSDLAEVQADPVKLA